MPAFVQLWGIAVSRAGDVYVTDSGSHTVWRISAQGVTTLLAGSQGERGTADGPGTAARFDGPEGVAVDAAGNLYVSDSGNDTIGRITPEGYVSAFAGRSGEPGSQDGRGSDARFSGPAGIGADAVGNLYVADRGNFTIRKITPSGDVSTIAGSPGRPGHVDGIGSAARFGDEDILAVMNLAADSDGNVYVADLSGQPSLRKVTPDGLVTTLWSYLGLAVAVDSTGDIYTADYVDNAIVKTTSDGRLIILGTAEVFGLAVDAAGTVFLAEQTAVQKIGPDGQFMTLAGVAAVQETPGSPMITKQPLGQSLSVGADPKFQVIATSTNGSPIRYQWVFHGAPLPGATNATLVLTNVGTTAAGSYAVTVSDGVEFVTSQPVILDVDPTFRKITSGPVVTDGGESWSVEWGDYDSDGYLDLYVTNGTHSDNRKNFLYHNERDGTLRKITAGLPVEDAGLFRGCAWIDIDNDGLLDLSVMGHGTGNFLYRNNGDGTFSRLEDNIVFQDVIQDSIGGAWTDYDRDGFLDLFISNANGAKNYLYHGNGDGTFSKITSGTIVNDVGNSLSCAWADYDGDGFPDLLVSNYLGPKNFLYHNNGDGTFLRVLGSRAGSIVTDASDSVGCAWGDYDNDGFPDLFVANGSPSGAIENDFLYHNNGDGTFTRVLAGPPVEDPSRSPACAWGDYDNDGYLDLFVVNLDRNCCLYNNNGDGSFTKITRGSPVNDGGPNINSSGCSWGDYDNDGFLDLIVANGGGPATSPVNNFLYHNEGNGNSWIKIRCVGTVSNRSALGTKVRVKAAIRGKVMWQLREVSCGDGFQSGNPLETHFGLGDASNIEEVRIEWPSGIVQKLAHVPARQILTVTEPARLTVQRQTGQPQVWLKGGRGNRYQIESSIDLEHWSAIGVFSVTNVMGQVQITPGSGPNSDRAFYRAISR
jgi:hypothetical protein